MICEGILNLCGTSSEEIIERTKKEDAEFYMPKINELSNSNKQLTSSNEQLISSNEQLTSSNEQLTSYNKQLASSNEHLTSFNKQLSTQINYLKTLLKQNNIPYDLESVAESDIGSDVNL